MIFDDVEPKEPIIKKYFCRGRHNNCNMIYLNQNLFFCIDVVLERIVISLFYLNKKVMYFIHYIKTSLMIFELDYKDVAIITTKVWKEPYN